MDHPVSKVRKVLKIAQEPISLETTESVKRKIHILATSSRIATSSRRQTRDQPEPQGTDRPGAQDAEHRVEKVNKDAVGVGDGSEHTRGRSVRTSQSRRERIRQIEARRFGATSHIKVA